MSALPVLITVLLIPAQSVPVTDTPTDDKVAPPLFVTLTYTFKLLPASKRGLLGLVGS